MLLSWLLHFSSFFFSYCLFFLPFPPFEDDLRQGKKKSASSLARGDDDEGEEEQVPRRGKDGVIPKTRSVNAEEDAVNDDLMSFVRLDRGDGSGWGADVNSVSVKSEVVEEVVRLNKNYYFE